MKVAKRRVYKNVVVLGLAFLLNFSSYISAQALQSSINLEEGLGTTGLAVLYGVFVVSNLFLPKFCIRNFGCNYTIAISFIGYAAFAAANLYATWWTIILGATLCGLSAGPLWSSQSTYVTQIGRAYSSDSGELCEDVVSRLFGIFYTLMTLCAIGGNIASSVLLANVNNTTYVPMTELARCGVDFCPADYNATNAHLTRPPQKTIQILMVIFIALNILSSILVIVFLDKIDYDKKEDSSETNPGENKETPLLNDENKSNETRHQSAASLDLAGQFKVHQGKEGDSSVKVVITTHGQTEEEGIDTITEQNVTASEKLTGTVKRLSTKGWNEDQLTLSWRERLRPELLIATVKLMKEVRLMLIIPLALLSGMLHGFSTAELTQSYVGCTEGIWMVGYIAMAAGVAAALVSMVIGKIKSVARVVSFITAIVMSAAGLILALVWKNLNAKLYILFIISCLLGAGHIALEIGLNTTLGLQFIDHNEAAFANLKLWQSVACVVTFAYSTYNLEELDQQETKYIQSAGRKTTFTRMEQRVLLLILGGLALLQCHLAAEKMTTDQRLEQLSRQLMLQQFFTEQRVRSEGNSGIKQTRNMATGTKAYHQRTHVGTGIAAIHEHANNIRTVGMGEFIAVLNGVEFKTRHNDYRLRMPHPTSNKYHEMVDVPFPEVPPQVKSQPTIEKQILEMREWFKAWKDNNDKERNFKDYFKPVVCYLEGSWTSSNGQIDEPFFSDRHFIDAKEWSELMEKARYTAHSGGKSRLENFAYLPVTIFNVNNGTPIFAQWNYRIACHPIKTFIPLHAFHLVEDLRTRMNMENTPEELSLTRRARFQINFKLRPEKRYREEARSRPTLLDEIMSEVPGKDNYQGDITDETLDGRQVQSTTRKKLNAAYYHRFYLAAGRDAMGDSIQRRGFADDTVFMARTTQEKIPALTQKICQKKKKKKTCTSHTSSWTYAFPLEIIWLTPLSSWNPYNLTMQSKSKRSFVGGRNGKMTEDKAYNGIHDRLYYITPAEFYGKEGKTSDRDRADTAKGVVGVLDQTGVVRAMKSAGTKILFPTIPGVGRLRQRYPIMPVHMEGNSIYKEVEALTDMVMEMKKYIGLYRSPPVGGNGTVPPSTYTPITLQLQSATRETVGPHQHSVELSRSEVEDAMNGEFIDVVTTIMSGHDHELRIGYSEGEWFLVQCDDKLHCWDGHPDVLFREDEE
ncbi:unnamed protein product [Owenia fusiformis]|uniref:Uncharacterized protein n=1 Tax=Owenia fusiformis TaxID=6347 RepID=A0A8J1TT73_OWEFU|nr:unnamed protein product [Owenia fusiformis]